MAGLVFPNDAGQINYALCMGHNYTGTDPFQPAVPWPLTAPCLEFHIIHQHVCVFLSVSALSMYFSVFISQMFEMERGACYTQTRHDVTDKVTVRLKLKSFY